ncbi:hypothetical protein N7451_011414 [Penicillium sp. IBT 35674x]|nr:hypothetical protein N7451_011414 [Penicillium sp. IBT 35674x]
MGPTMLVAQNANVGGSFSGPEVFLVGADNWRQYTYTLYCELTDSRRYMPRVSPDVLRTSSRGTPHETSQHRSHSNRRLTNPELRRTFSSTSATRIRLEDDGDEGLEPPENGRASKKPVRRPPPGPPKDLRSIILSREPKPRKPKSIDPEKVREIEAKVQMLPDPRQLLNEFLDSRYIHLDEQIARALSTTREIFCSHIEGLKSLVLCSEVDCQRIELEYCKFVYRNTPKWTAAISNVEKAITRLRYEFVTGCIEDSQLFTYRVRELLEREYLSPRQSARAKVDKLLQPTEDMREEYRSLQSLGRAVLSGLSAIKSLIVPLKVLDEHGPGLPGPGFQDFQNVFEAHKQDYAMAAHKHRADWFARVQNTTLVESQLWSAKKLTSSLLESMPERSPRKTISLLFKGGLLQGDDEAVRESARVFLSFHRDQTLAANRLRKSYTKKWSGVKPANSPELNKVWRQLDVMALFETQQALDMSLQYEVWILMKSLEGKFGPMWPGLDSGASREIQQNLHEFSVKFNWSRKLFAAELEMYRLANWARLNVEEKLHKLGEPNDIQKRGLFMVSKPLSQDHSRFNHWANHFVAVTFKNWNLNRILKFSMEESEESVHNHYVRLAEDYLEQMNRLSSFVPEIGTTEARDSRPQRKKDINIKRPLFPMLNKMGPSDASTAPEALSLPTKHAAKSTSSSPPQALETTRPKVSSKKSPPMTDMNTLISVETIPSGGGGKQSPKKGVKVGKSSERRTLGMAAEREIQPQTLERSTFGDNLTDSSANLSPPSPQEETSMQHLKNRHSVEQSFKNPMEDSADNLVDRNPRETHKKQSTQQHERQRHVKQSAKELTYISLPSDNDNRPLPPPRSPYRVRDVQRKLDLDFLSGQTDGIRPYSTRPYFSEAKTNVSGVGCADEQSLPLGASSPRETTVGSEENVKDGVPPLFWTHSSQRGPGGQKLIVHYCRTLESTEEVARLFLDSKVIGFDMEWKAQASAWDSIQSNLSLIQVANEERIALFQIALFKPGQTLKDLVAPSLKQLLESPDITKVGVSIKADATRLRKYLGVEARSIFELSHLFKLVKYGLTQPKLVNKRGVNLSDQAEEHLGLPLEKSEDVRCGDWTRPLNYRQVQYAATDPYACICLFNVMDQKRQAMDSIPPLPAHAELNLPIVLPPREKEPIASSPVDESGDVDVRS